MGIEALSRGAAQVYFVDHNPVCLDAAKTNLAPFGLPGEAHYVKAELPAWNPPADLDLVIADPPYGPLDPAALLREVRAPRVIIENDRFMAAPVGWEVVKEKRYGTTFVTMFERTEDE